MKSRYIEKATGRWWSMGIYDFGDIDGKGAKVKLYDYDNEKVETDWLSKEEFERRFDYVPWPEPKVVVTPVGMSAESPAKQRIYIQLYCTECGSPLSFYGRCCPSSPLQYPHKCSNPNCKYDKTIFSVHHGMFADATEAQVSKLEAGTYTEFADGSLENCNSKFQEDSIVLSVPFDSVGEELEYCRRTLEAVEKILANPKFMGTASEAVVSLFEKRKRRVKGRIAELEAGAKL